eukprot:CAMPEP_0197545620 /NCGR_PEP_ID=MMETSP1320-20131121/588_1 /TAXON_ID=91990 /ORGANISM="Bolidomonas sp., Strain RCC2347" /LENGTH=133 /DNA_ID=CAMNT_0043105139 /DNA_START=99 /DNA_END=500 /DNA_ORIENTATION=-
MSGLAAVVDSDLSEFRGLQSQISNLRQTQQKLMQQQNENDMVKAELGRLQAGKVYKMVGPVLVEQDLEEAKTTVEKRLEFITNDLGKVEADCMQKEEKAREVADKIRKAQTEMQRQAKEEVDKIQAQAQEGQI